MEEKVLDILERLCGTDEVRNNREINMFENGLMDSLGFIELVLAMEEDFGLSVEPTEVQREEIDTPNKVIDYIKSRI
jgi:D-alanine--poly(phosphoribitol) ligase, subunit 2